MLWGFNKSKVLSNEALTEAEREGATLTDALKAGPFQQAAATQVETGHKQAIVLQDLLHRAVAQPLFLHREVDLRGP